MAYTEVLTDHDLTAEQWDTSIAEEYIQQLWFYHVMGESTDMPIMVKMELQKNPGDAITIGIRGRLQGGHVTGNEQGEGNEGKVDFYGQRIVINKDRQLVKVKDVPMSQKRVPWDVLKQVKEALVEQNKQQLEDDIMTALIDVASGRKQGRYLYGATDSNYNSTHATALATIDNTDDQLTTTVLDKVKRKAQNLQGQSVAKVRPMKVKVGDGKWQEWFCTINHPFCIRDMITNDAAWKNAQLNLPPIGMADSVLYTGSSFKGSWNGVLIYEWDRVALASSTIQVAHNLFLGAQAAAIAWGQNAKFTEKTDDDMGHNYIAETSEIRGQQKIVYRRNAVDGSLTDEDNGVIHYFNAAVND